MNHRLIRLIACLLLLSGWRPPDVRAQADSAYGLRQLMELAAQNHPQLKAAQSQVNAARSRVIAEKSTLTPSLDVSYQANLATYNNITGMTYPGAFLPISGPPSADNTYDPVYGSVAGALFSWTPITFGQRSAQVRRATGEQQAQEAVYANELLTHQVRIGEAYLDWLMATQLIVVQQNNLERAEQTAVQVTTLVANGLRPGVDSALIQAEISRARVELLRARRDAETHRIALLERIAQPDTSGPIRVDSAFYTTVPQPQAAPNAAVSHPLIEQSQRALAASQSAKSAIWRSLFPTLTLFGTAYARGSGIAANGEVGDRTDGLQFSRYNYGVGVQLLLPLLGYPMIRARAGEAGFLVRAYQERVRYAEGQVNQMRQTATTTLSTAIAVAEETPRQLSAAQYAYRSMQTRYETGLTDIPDLVQAQYVLVRAEADQQQAIIDAWRALLQTAAAQGNVNVFLNQIK